MKKLYAPGMIGSLEVKNRLVMAPMVDGYSNGGVPTERSLEYYRVRAAGGVGLIIVGNIHVDPAHRHVMPGFNLYEDSFAEKLRPLVNVIHEGGAKTFAQLIHQGRYAKTRDYIDGVQAVAPSALFTRITGETPRELTIEEILDLEDFFAQAAGRAVEAGFDGIEICTNSGYLFGQFLSPLTNIRTDQYGGCLENRTRFLVETIGAVRGKVGKKVPVTIRMGGSDFVAGSNTNKEACQIAVMAEQAGVDAVSVTGGWHESGVPQVSMDLPHGIYSYLGRNIRRSVTVPVMMGNRMNVKMAEKLIEWGDMDFAVFGRPMLADPEFPRKAAEGRVDDIRPCLGCNQGCLDNSMSGKSIQCLCNAECGRESILMDDRGRLPTEIKAGHIKNILVIGAGVAGMEFSRTAALRGHSVVIWEKGNSCGGQLNLASAPPARHDFRYLTEYLWTACIKAGVKFCFGKQANAQTILNEVKQDHFDHVVIATGAVPVVPDIPAEDGAHVVQAWDVLTGNAQTGTEVVVVGGGAVGIETSILLGEEGTLTPEALRFLTLYRAESQETLYEMLNSGSKNISIVEMLDKSGKDIGKTTRWIMMDRLRKLGVKIHTGTRVAEIKKDRVVAEGPDGTRELMAVTVVLAIGSKSESSLYEQIKKEFDGVSIIGDARTPRKAMDAVREAYDLGCSIG